MLRDELLPKSKWRPCHCSPGTFFVKPGLSACGGWGGPWGGMWGNHICSVHLLSCLSVAFFWVFLFLAELERLAAAEKLKSFTKWVFWIHREMCYCCSFSLSTPSSPHLPLLVLLFPPWFSSKKALDSFKLCNDLGPLKIKQDKRPPFISA